MSPKTNKILATVVAVYLIASPIYIGVATYKWVSYKNEVASWQKAVDKDLQKELDAFVLDAKKK